jgi:hypothetical protein
MVAHPCLAEGRREQGSGRLPIRAEGLAVVQQLGVVFSRSPTAERFFQLTFV